MSMMIQPFLVAHAHTQWVVEVVDMAGDKEKGLPVDKGWAWVVVAAATSLFALQTGAFKSQGILLVELTEKFEGVYPTSMLIWIMTVRFTVGALMAPAVGVLVVKFSHRTVAAAGIICEVSSYISLAYADSFIAILLLFAIPSGVGGGMMYLTPYLVSGQYFRKKKALALGIITAGSGIGSMVIPYVYRLLFDNYSFSEACLLYGGFSLQFLIAVCMFRPMSYYSKPVQRQNKPAVEQQEETTTFVDQEMEGDATASSIDSTETHNDIVEKPAQDRFMWRVILMPKFLLVEISVCIYSFGTFFVFQGLPPLGKESGVSKNTMAIAFMVAGGIEIPCRVINGLIADRKWIANTTQYALGMFVSGVMSLLCALTSGLAGVTLVLFGMSVFGWSVFSIIPVVIAELLGNEYVTSGMSIQVFCMGSSFIATSYITGAIYDASGTWTTVYFYLASAMILASFIVWPYCIIRWWRQRYGMEMTETGASHESITSTDK